MSNNYIELLTVTSYEDIFNNEIIKNILKSIALLIFFNYIEKKISYKYVVYRVSIYKSK